MKRLLLAVLLGAGCASSSASSGAAVRHAVGSPARLEYDRAVAAQLRRISARVQKGEVTQVREELLAQAQSRPDDANLQMQLAWTGAPSEEAWQELNRLRKLNAEEPWFPTACGYVYLQWRGFLDKADAEFQRAARVRSDFLPAQVGRADVLRLQGKLEEAKQVYEAVLAKQPDWEEALVGLGLTQVALGDARARATLERALGVDPDDLRAIAALGALAVEAKDSDAAIRLFSRQVEFDPRDRPARFALAQMREQKGELAAAAADYELAASLSTDAPVLGALARVYRALGRGEDEARALERLAEAEPRDPAPLRRLAELRQANEDLEAAEHALRGAAERAPDDASLLLALARLARDRGDLIASIETFRQARRQGVADAEAELTDVQLKANLPEKPFAGSVNRVYQDLFRRLRATFQERQKQRRGLGGKLRAKVSIGADGKATEVELVEDSVHDEVLAALVHFGLKDAVFPKEKKSPTFEFVLKSRL